MNVRTLSVTTTLIVDLDGDGEITEIGYSTNFGYRPSIMRQLLQHAIDNLDTAKGKEA